MLFLILYLLKVRMSCTNSEGTFIIRVKIHLDELTHMKLLSLEKLSDTSDTKGKREYVKNYLNRIFNEINYDFYDYGVQLEGDYSILLFEELELNMKKDKICDQKNLAMKVTNEVFPKLSYPETDGLGLRIIGISCPAFPPEQLPFYTTPNFGCGNLATILVVDPITLKIQIKLLLKSFVTNGIGDSVPVSSDAFRKALCKYAEKCTKNNNKLGEYKKDVTYLRHGQDEQKEPEGDEPRDIPNLREKEKQPFYDEENF